MISAKASALWITAPGQAELRAVDIRPREGEAQIRTLYSGISRGTERLVFSGSIPESEHETMQAPFQEGAFSFPVKYGYAAVGELLNTEHAGQRVFALYPHQSRFAVPTEAAFHLPKKVPAERAILAANMETALNITWDAGIGPGDAVAVVGCGVVGALVGYLAARIPGTTVTLIDINPQRHALAAQLGCAFATPETASGDADVVIHTSATSAGLSSAIDLAGLEARIVEASWYGAHSTDVPLGGRFHQRRLKIISSQVGRIPADRAARWTFARRLTKALSLLDDPALDALIATESDFSNLANDYATILTDPSTLCHRVRYDG